MLNELQARTGTAEIRTGGPRAPKVDFVIARRGRPPLAIECKWRVDGRKAAGRSQGLSASVPPGREPRRLFRRRPTVRARATARDTRPVPGVGGRGRGSVVRLALPRTQPGTQAPRVPFVEITEQDATALAEHAVGHVQQAREALTDALLRVGAKSSRSSSSMTTRQRSVMIGAASRAASARARMAWPGMLAAKSVAGGTGESADGSGSASGSAGAE